MGQQEMGRQKHSPLHESHMEYRDEYTSHNVAAESHMECRDEYTSHNVAAEQSSNQIAVKAGKREQHDHDGIGSMTMMISQLKEQLEELMRIAKQAEDESSCLQQKYKIIQLEYEKLEAKYKQLQLDHDQMKQDQIANVNIIVQQPDIHPETDIQMCFGYLSPDRINYFDAGFALVAFAIDCCLIALGEEVKICEPGGSLVELEQNSTSRHVLSIVGFVVAMLSMLLTALGTFAEAKFHGVKWDNNWWYKSEKTYVPLPAMGEVALTGGSIFLFGNSIPLWRPLKLKPGVHHFCLGISTCGFFYKCLKPVITKVVKRWWWTGV